MISRLVIVLTKRRCLNFDIDRLCDDTRRWQWPRYPRPWRIKTIGAKPVDVEKKIFIYIIIATAMKIVLSYSIFVNFQKAYKHICVL